MDIKKDNAMYMRIAHIAAERSYAKRLKVGCVIVKNHSIISFGWNGMPTGYDNCCEMEVDGKLVTRPEVQHAELNAIAKLAEKFGCDIVWLEQLSELVGKEMCKLAAVREEHLAEAIRKASEG